MEHRRVVCLSGGNVGRGNFSPDRETVGHLGAPFGRREPVPVGWGCCEGSCLGVFECGCVSVGFGIRLVLSGFRGLCTVVFSLTSNVVVVVSVSVFRVFGLFCGLVGEGV